MKKIVKSGSNLAIEAEFHDLSRYGGRTPQSDEYFYLAMCIGDNASAQFVMRDVTYPSEDSARATFDCKGFSERIDNYVQKNGLKNEVQRKLMIKVGEYL